MVILTRRDPNMWVDSVKETVASPALAKAMLRTPLMPAVLAQNPLGFRIDREAMLVRFEHYGSAVRREIPPERLLVFEAGDGWEPLCGFLNVPVPDRPFPHTNDRDAMLHMARNADAMNFPSIQQLTRDHLDAARNSNSC